MNIRCEQRCTSFLKMYCRTCGLAHQFLNLDIETIVLEHFFRNFRPAVVHFQPLVDGGTSIFWATACANFPEICSDFFGTKACLHLFMVHTRVLYALLK